MRPSRETWIVGALLTAFVLASVALTRTGDDARQIDRPTTYSVAARGLKALYELFQRRAIAVSRFEEPFEALPDDAAVLVITEPLVRPVADAELAALRAWVERGGVAVVVVASGWPQRSLDGIPFEWVGVTNSGQPTGTAIPWSDPPSRYAADIRSLPLTTSTRLVNEAEWRQSTVFADGAGACVVAWRVGDGEAIAVSDALAPGNGAIRDNDTALLYLNIAAAHANRTRPRVLFDEYHQGFGQPVSRERSLWSAVGAPLRTAFWVLLGLAAIAILSANRRFGRIRTLQRPSSRPSTEYIDSMADLYRRAAASGIAIELLYRPFVRELARRLDAAPDATHEQIARLAEERFGWPSHELTQMMQRCERIVDGAEVSEAEMLALARQMDDYRRRADLVRLSR